MPTRVSPPSSSSVVVIADGLVERYKAQGWSVVGGSPAVAAYSKPFSQFNRSELEQVASDEDVDVSKLTTNEEFRSAIRAARDTK